MSKLKPISELSSRYLAISSCRDCKQFNPKMFMLKDRIWNRITTKQERRKVLLLCLSCVVHRLGRPITHKDFYTNVPLNRTLITVLKATNNSTYTF